MQWCTQKNYICTLKRIYMKTSFIFFLAIILFVSTIKRAQAQAKRPKVGVVLSGGGAKSAAQIGFLKYLEELDIPVDYITGSSMGAVIGGFYALGYDAAEIEEIITKIDWGIYMTNSIQRDRLSSQSRFERSSYLFTIPFGIRNDKLYSLQGDVSNAIVNQTFISSLPSSVINGTKITNLFNSYCIGYLDSISFDDLYIPYACIGTNFKTGEEVVLNSGNLPWAMRASMAIPGVFSPIRINGQILVDGGLSNIFPADVCKEMGADIIIGIEATDGLILDDDRLQSLPQLALQFVNISVAKKADQNRKLCDIYVHPDISGFNMLSFEKSSIDTLIKRGYQAAERNRDKLLAIKELLDSCDNTACESKPAKARYLKDESLTLNSINFNIESPKEIAWLLHKGHLQDGKMTKGSNIERAIDIYEGTGYYTKTTYTISEADSCTKSGMAPTYDLNINLNRTPPHSVGLGFRYDTEENAAFLLNFGLNRHRLGGFKMDLTARLSSNSYISTTLTWAQRGLANFNLSYQYHNTEFKVFESPETLDIIRMKDSKFSFYVSEFYLRNFKTEIGMEYEVIPLTEVLDSKTTNTTSKHYGPHVRFTFDNRDDAYFAKKGSILTLYGDFRNDIETGKQFSDMTLKIATCLSFFGKRLTLIPQVYHRSCIGDIIPTAYSNFAGGYMEGRYVEQQMPFIGLLNTTSIGRHASVARFDLRYNIFKKHYVGSTVNYIRHANCFTEYFGNGTATQNWGVGINYSVNTLIGPISLLGQWSNITNRFSVFFNLGYTF